MNTDARHSRLSLDINDPNGHLSFQRFGLTTLESENQLDVLLRELDAVRPTTAEFLTRLAYQTDYGIYNHDLLRNKRPLAMVRMHEKEDVVEGGYLFSRIRRYHINRIYKHFGLNLIEFMELPQYVIELLFEITQVESVVNESQAHALQQELNNSLNKE